MTADIHCKIVGIDSMGKSIPESITTGISNTIAERSKATNWVLATVEIRSPNDKAKRI